FSKTTIFNEVHRLAGEYHSVKAQTDHEVKLSHRGRKTILTTNQKRLIEEKIKIQKCSIEQVAHVVRIAYKTIYNWIDQGLLYINVTDLPNHGIRLKRVLRRFIPKGQPIDEITDDE
ncbi:IS30 family transposase, partial [Lactiplantibacillus plantarum]|nr:IS30 family transposase [Lactiplantibacillus plantarum]